MIQKSEQQEIDRKGRRLLWQALEPLGWVLSGFEEDFGIDYDVQVFVNGSPDGLWFKIQLKSSGSSDYSAGGIINVHFLLPKLFPSFIESLIPGGYLLIQTVPGCGGNYLQLPKSNELRSALSEHFDFEFYQERPVGPSAFNSVTVNLLAKRRP